MIFDSYSIHYINDKKISKTLDINYIIILLLQLRGNTKVFTNELLIYLISVDKRVYEECPLSGLVVFLKSDLITFGYP